MYSVTTEKNKDDQNFENYQFKLCLICCSNVDTNKNHESSKTELISKNVQVIFLLRNLLQVPSFQLERNLKEYGNPETWICLCEQCTRLITQALDLHFQVIKMTKKLKSLKKLIVTKTRSSSATPTQNNSSKLYSKGKEIWKSTRKFVLNYGYISSTSADLINPFAEGDKLARYLVSEQDPDQSLEDDEDKTSCPSPPQIKVEVEPDDDNDTGSFYNNSNYDDDDDDMKDAENDINKETTFSSTSRHGTKDQTQAHSELPWSQNRKNKKMLRINGRWKCRYCDKSFRCTRTVYAHEHKDHGSSKARAQYICDICGKACYRIKDLNFHRRKVHKIRLDENSSTTEPSKPKPVVASSRASEEDPQSCDLCGKVFKNKVNLEGHVKFVHDKVREHKCHLCEMKFALSSYLKRHQLTVHKDDPDIRNLIAEGIRIWRCKVVGCRAQFMRKSNLEKHSAKLHSSTKGKKRFTCTYCAKGFWSAHYLKTHELLHKNKDKKPYCCDLCDSRFAAPLFLKVHKNRSHKNETQKRDSSDV